MNEQEKSTVEKIMGYCGMMLALSKSGYTKLHPTHTVIFNANLCTEKHGKIWYGDIDLSLKKDKKRLKELAVALQEKIYVLYEHHARFENEASPLLSKAIFVQHVKS